MSRRTPVRNGLCRWWKRNAEPRLNGGSCKGLPTAFLFLLLTLVPHRAKAPPFLEDTRPLPGQTAGKVESYWLAPLVHVTEEGVGRIRGKTVTWYLENGTVITRRVEGVQPGIAFAHENGQEIVLGLNEDWEFALPKEVDPNDPMAIRFIHCTKSSHVLVDQFSPDHKQVTLAIYVDGKPASRLGPFRSHLGRSAELGSDGSVAFITWKDSSETSAQIVLTDAEGKLSARIDCEETDGTPIPAPNGAGALLPGPGGSQFQNFFSWYTPEGKLRSMQVSSNPHFLGWVPGTQRSLFSTSLGEAHRYRMIDWASGRELWDIPCPADGKAFSIEVTPKLVLFAVAESYQGGPCGGESWILGDGRKEWTRAFYAVSADDGRMVARWQARYPARLLQYGREHFARRGDKLYYITADEVVELSEDDILAGKNRWERVGDGKK